MAQAQQYPCSRPAQHYPPPPPEQLGTSQPHTSSLSSLLASRRHTTKRVASQVNGALMHRSPLPLPLSAATLCLLASIHVGRGPARRQRRSNPLCRPPRACPGPRREQRCSPHGRAMDQRASTAMSLCSCLFVSHSKINQSSSIMLIQNMLASLCLDFYVSWSATTMCESPSFLCVDLLHFSSNSLSFLFALVSIALARKRFEHAREQDRAEPSQIFCLLH